MRRAVFRSEVLLFIVFVAVLLGLFIHPIDTDGDFFQHVNIGRYVVTHHTLPRVDDLTFTAKGRPYIGYAWMAGVVFYEIYSVVGAVGVNILVFAIALLTFWLLYRYLRSIGIPHGISLLTLFIIAPVAASRWPTRPEIFMYPILLGFLILDEVKKSRRWIIWLYPPLMLLLVNMYGSSFPFAAGLLILLVLKNWLGREKRVQYYTAMALSFPVALVNGYGLRSLLFIFLIPKMTTLWGDWVGLLEILRHPEYNFSWEISFIYFVFVMYVTILALVSWRNLKKLLFYAIIAATVFLPFLAVRMRALAAIFSAPFIGLVLFRIQSKWIVISTTVVALGMVVLCMLFTNLPQLGEYTAVFPLKLIRFIKTYDLRGNVFNTPRIGSFLSYYLAPNVLTFSDTRDDLFIGTGVLEATQTFLSRGASISYLLWKYHINFVVVNLMDGRSFRDLVYNPAWALVYDADGYMIFVPRVVAQEKRMPILDTLDPYSITGERQR